MEGARSFESFDILDLLSLGKGLPFNGPLPPYVDVRTPLWTESSPRAIPDPAHGIFRQGSDLIPSRSRGQRRITAASTSRLKGTESRSKFLRQSPNNNQHECHKTYGSSTSAHRRAYGTLLNLEYIPKPSEKWQYYNASQKGPNPN